MRSFKTTPLQSARSVAVQHTDSDEGLKDDWNVDKECDDVQQ